MPKVLYPVKAIVYYILSYTKLFKHSFEIEMV